jgi:hypothetical protein
VYFKQQKSDEGATYLGCIIPEPYTLSQSSLSHTFLLSFKGATCFMIANENRAIVLLLVEALCFKTEGREFDPKLGHWVFDLTGYSVS